ncbi:MAG: methylmalonyl-CoA mutase family protein [Alphaproteobacteria bacterium]|nr:methylmalonyl-CoA mutase family protein [Alphaproteobacteria bacterium]
MSEHSTQAGLPLKPLYRPDDLEGFDYDRKLADPGTYPFTRGRRIEVGRKSWIHRELSGEGDPKRSNEQFKYLLEKGQTGIDVIGDMPTVSLLDPDHPMARHGVGTTGVSICRLQDYVDLLSGLPLDSISISQSLPAAFAMAGTYLAARELGADAKSLRGSIIQTPLYCDDSGYFIGMPVKLRLRLSRDSIEFATHEMPKFHAFLEDSYYISEGGIDGVEEMALAFIEIRHITRDLMARGLDIDAFAPRIAILLNCHMDFFETVAKIRATRRLFARMMKDEFSAQDPRSLACNIASHTSGLSMTAQQPVNNIARGTAQTLALAMAGVQAIEISTFDEAFRTPSPEAHLVGLRTQQVVALETNVAQVADPLGGSYFVEALTDDMEARIWRMVEEIEAAGDAAELAEQGYFRELFIKAMERRAAQVDDGTLMQVGVNCHQIAEEEDRLLKEVAERKIDPDYARIEAITDFRAQRDMDRVRTTLAEVRGQAEDFDHNIMPEIIAATAGGATMGEIAGVLRQAYGGDYDPYNMATSPLD